MINLSLIILPLIGALVIWLNRKKADLPQTVLLLAAFLHTVLTAALWVLPRLGIDPNGQILSDWLDVTPDELSKLILSIVSILFLGVAIQMHKWLPAERAHYADSPVPLQTNRVMMISLLGFLSSMTLVTLTCNMGLLWVAVEATTLASAPLIIFNHSGKSLEAMWKYILICSVGIGLALFGTMLLAIAAGGGHNSLDIDHLLECTAANAMHPLWFKAAFIFILGGYGTKMGLAPFHTWLPDAHSEAPGVVSALLSGALLNCSFLGIVRVWSFAPESEQAFCNSLLIALGIFSLATAAFFIIRQSDYKRMLAYSSVEHMGLIALMWGLGCQMATGLHLCMHSLLKMTLFMVAGNLLLACHTRQIPLVSGLLKKLPRNAMLWMVAVLLICGMPPSPLFITEFGLIAAAGPVLGTVILLLLFAVFAGMTQNVLKMTMGEEERLQITAEDAQTAEKLTKVPFIVLSLVFAAGIILTVFFVTVWGE